MKNIENVVMAINKDKSRNEKGQPDRQKPCNSHKKEDEADFTVLLQVALQFR